MLFVGGPLHGLTRTLTPEQAGRPIVALDEAFYSQVHAHAYAMHDTMPYEHIYTPQRVVRPVRIEDGRIEEVTATFYVSNRMRGSLKDNTEDAIVNAWFAESRRTAQ